MMEPPLEETVTMAFAGAGQTLSGFSRSHAHGESYSEAPRVTKPGLRI